MEYTKKCNVCGKVFCYTDEDIRKNASNSLMAGLNALGGLASLGGGTIFHTQHFTQQGDRYSDKVVDFNQCPYCHSRDISFCTKEEAAALERKASTPAITINSGASTEALLKRAFMFLEDGDWFSAEAYSEACLDKDPELAEAYLVKLMAELKVKERGALKDQAEPFEDKNNYQKALRFADEQLRTELWGYIEHINDRNENARKSEIYTCATKTMSAANNESAYREAARLFSSISDYRDSSTLAQECSAQAEIARKDSILASGTSRMEHESIPDYEAAVKLFASIPNWKDADKRATICREKIIELKAKEELARKQAEKRAKQGKKAAIIAAPFICAAIAFAIVLFTVIIPNNKYIAAVALLDEGKYEEAIAEFEALKDHKESIAYLTQAKYERGIQLLVSGSELEAYELWKDLGDYKDVQDRLKDFVSYPKDVFEYESYGNTDTEYKYSEAGLLLKKHSRTEDGSEYDDETTTYVYDANGNCIREETVYESKFYDSNLQNYKTNKGQYSTIYSYDLEGRLVQEYYSSSGSSENYFYDITGKCNKIERKDKKGNVTAVETLTYDAQGNVTKTERIGFDKSEEQITNTYSYDEGGRCIEHKRTYKSRYNSGSTSKTIYTYDSAGNCIKEVVTEDGKYAINYTIDRTYNENNKLIRQEKGSNIVEYEYDADGNLYREYYVKDTSKELKAQYLNYSVFYQPRAFFGN